MQKLIFTLLTATLFLFACKNETKPSAANESQPVAPASGKTYSVSTVSSKVLWLGSTPTSKHNGTFPIKEGKLTVDKGVITSGSFVLDLNNLTVDDLTGDDKADLESHLKGTGTDGQEDFFNVKKYPTATFELTKVTGLANDPAGNALVYGNLSMLGVTKEVNFKANINVQDNNVTVNTPVFTINRTDWNLKYKSKTFSDLKDKFIHDDVELQVILNATVSQ